MKKSVLNIISALICIVIFCDASCNKEDVANSALSIKAVVYAKSDIPGEAMKTDTLLFNGDNIEWFNEKTDEVKFKRMIEVNAAEGLKSIIVHLEDTELFTLHAVSSLSSFERNYPVLIESFDRFYIGRGYSNFEYWTEEFWTHPDLGFLLSVHVRELSENWVQERENNWKAIEQGWNKFIEYLNKEGKYIK